METFVAILAVVALATAVYLFAIRGRKTESSGTVAGGKRDVTERESEK